MKEIMLELNDTSRNSGLTYCTITTKLPSFNAKASCIKLNMAFYGPECANQDLELFLKGAVHEFCKNLQ